MRELIWSSLEENGLLVVGEPAGMRIVIVCPCLLLLRLVICPIALKSLPLPSECSQGCQQTSDSYFRAVSTGNWVHPLINLASTRLPYTVTIARSAMVMVVSNSHSDSLRDRFSQETYSNVDTIHTETDSNIPPVRCL